MLNPSLQNFRVTFGENFFSSGVIEKYDDYLFHQNTPFNTMKACFHESIQSLNIPGLNISPLIIQGLNNTGNNPYADGQSFQAATTSVAYAGSDSWWNVLETTVLTVTFRNNILNWMLCYENMYKYYLRQRTVSEFTIILDMMDSAEIPIIRIIAKDCFVANMPGMEWSNAQAFNESKTFDVGFQFNDLDVQFNVPDWNKINFNLISKTKK